MINIEPANHAPLLEIQCGIMFILMFSRDSGLFRLWQKKTLTSEEYVTHS